VKGLGSLIGPSSRSAVIVRKRMAMNLSGTEKKETHMAVEAVPPFTHTIGRFQICNG
jgi:hypothetical protein